ncbi:helix-turn-helix domain-containing protein [Erythrobacter sp. NE805]|uniref:helix-turn-helix domain-containing protein n=1 Tax=Erythrobacter sp. NE805 TaxID=3389875 RepID=UPI00396B15D7
MATRKRSHPALPSTTQERAPENLGLHIRELRSERRWSLSELSSRSGIAASTLSKVENDTLSLTYDRLLMVARGFGMSLSEFLAPRGDAGTSSQGIARISWARFGSGERVVTGAYKYDYLCGNLRQKRMIPLVAEVRARTLEEFGPLLRHEGEEFVFVLEGRVEVNTEFYAPEVLEKGEGVYIDSRQGHAYLNASDGVSIILSVNSETPKDNMITD